MIILMTTGLLVYFFIGVALTVHAMKHKSNFFHEDFFVDNENRYFSIIMLWPFIISMILTGHVLFFLWQVFTVIFSFLHACFRPFSKVPHRVIKFLKKIANVE